MGAGRSQAARAWSSLAFVPRPGAALGVWRMGLGLLIAWSACRFLLYGWVEQFFLAPRYFFPFWGLEWIPRPGVPWMVYGIFWALVVAGVCVSLGVWYRVSLGVALGLFLWVELLDVTNYLNHYYLLSMLCVWGMVMPLGDHYSLDAWRRGRWHGRWPGWMTWVLRAQLCVVYAWAGVAKCGADWLGHAQPMQIWMRSRADLMPGGVVGEVLTSFEAAWAMSVAGCLFDLTIWVFLLVPRTRLWAYGVVVLFHTTTGWLFEIGLFPLIMIVSTTVFFAADWPARVAPGWFGSPPAAAATPGLRASRPRSVLCTWLILGVLAVQVVFPARALLYGGNVLWHEQGMRWAWKVMVREKNGAVTYRVTWRGRQGEMHVLPGAFLTAHQAREMSGQPDMILRLAHHIGELHTKEGRTNVEVRVDALVSLNGRAAVRLIRPEVDLMKVRDTLAPADWILPAPTVPPRRTAPSLFL